MLTPDRLLRLVIEVIFIMLGGLLAWLGLTGRFHYGFNPTGVGWLALSIALIVWGARALFQRGKWWAQWENWTRGGSLVLLGALMFAIARVPFTWVGRLLAAAGVVLILRGFFAVFLVFRRG